eukprot:jgi/Bigna1/66125/fgenesh1_pg.1_\
MGKKKSKANTKDVPLECTPLRNPFKGENVFLDISSTKKLKAIQARLEVAEMRIVPSLDREVSILVTDQCIRRPTRQKSSQSKSSSRSLRGHKLFEASLKKAKGDSTQVVNIVNKAENMGIKVYSCERIERELDKLGILHQSQNQVRKKGTKRRRYPKLILGDLSGRYAAIVKDFSGIDSGSTYPEMNVDAKEGECPFLPKKRTKSAKSKAKFDQNWKLRGYCECCSEHYTRGLAKHVLSSKHKAFVNNRSNFKQLDELFLVVNKEIETSSHGLTNNVKENRTHPDSQKTRTSRKTPLLALEKNTIQPSRPCKEISGITKMMQEATPSRSSKYILKKRNRPSASGDTAGGKQKHVEIIKSKSSSPPNKRSRTEVLTPPPAIFSNDYMHSPIDDDGQKSSDRVRDGNEVYC